MEGTMSTNSVRTLLATCMLMALVACTAVVAAPPSPSQATGSHEYSLRPGEQVALEHGVLRYVRLVNDSRCAPDVQCIWAGDAEVAFEWMPNSGARRPFSLHTGVEPRRQAIGDRRLSIVSLARGAAPLATLRVEPAP